MQPSSKLLQELSIESWKDFDNDLPPILDIYLLGSHCFNYTSEYSDIELVVVGEFDPPQTGVRVLRIFKDYSKRIGIGMIDINKQKAPNWRNYTMPRFSLLTGKLTYYNKDSILAYIEDRGSKKPDYHNNRVYTDFYNTGINLQTEIEKLKAQNES